MTKKRTKISLDSILSGRDKPVEHKLALFAWLNLGIIESLTKQQLKPIEAVRIFFNGENCLFVRRRLRDEIADEIMSRGVQLADLFDILPSDEAQRRFEKELKKIRSLSLSLLEERSLAA